MAYMWALVWKTSLVLCSPETDYAHCVQEFTANYTEGVYRLDMGSGVTVRRVRVQVGNFTTRPCFRWELIGCEARM